MQRELLLSVAGFGSSVSPLVAAPAASPAGPHQAFYRPDIDGLRAVAVLAVIVFHFHAPLLPGGFLGVDVFFVISGFVISGSLDRERQERLRPFLLQFYARRIKRLLPLLAVCVLLTTLVAALVITPGTVEAQATWQTGIAALLGAGNLALLARQSDYFAPVAELNPFTHTWSLGVEEQFYLLFPLLVFGSGFVRGVAGGGRRLAFGLLALSLASLLGWLLLSERQAFYQFPVRFWELAAGSLAYLAWRARARLPWLARALPDALLALALLLLLALGRAAAPLATLAVVVVTALLLWQLRPGQFTTRLLSAEPLRQIGLLSYALYLWHWSVLSLSAWTVGVHAWTVPFQLVLIVGLAVASHRWIETPLRRARWAATPQLTLLIGLLLAGGSAALVNAQGHQLKGRLFSGDRAQAGMVPWQQLVGIAGTSVDGRHCHSGPGEHTDHFAQTERFCTTPRRLGDRRHLFVIGDSHALALLPLEDRLHRSLPWQISHDSRSGCPMPPSASGHESTGCWAFAQQARAAVLAAAGPGDVVLVHNYFRSHFGVGEDSRAMQLDARGHHVTDQAAKIAYYQRAVADFADALAARGASLVLVLDAPRFLTLKVPKTLCVREWFRPWLPAGCLKPVEITRAAHDADHRDLMRMAHTLAATHANVRLLDPADSLCSGGVCRSQDRQGQRLYRDRDHLSSTAALLLAPPLQRLLGALGH